MSNTPKIPVNELDFSALQIPEDTTQLLLCLTDSWDINSGTLLLCHRKQSGWTTGEPSIEISLGKNGLAWGSGLHTTATTTTKGTPAKTEGDAKSPAGIFEIGPVYGYAENKPAECKVPYTIITPFDKFIEDPTSTNYNTLFTYPDDTDPSSLPNRDEHAYELGIVVQHNMDPIIPSAGSAILMHRWKTPNGPTAGCTAMSRQSLVRVTEWLSPVKHPVIVQLPSELLVK